MTINTTKTQVEVHCDNFFDLFAADYAFSLVADAEKNKDGEWDIAVDGGRVSALVRWVLRHNETEESANWYTIDRVSAANILVDCANMK